MSWTKLGSGTFNQVYISDDKKSVLKIQKLPFITDLPNRAVRVWNEINQHIKPDAYEYHSEHGDGWVCPFIKGRQANDQEISESLIDIFNRTGRIIVDAISPKNFVTTEKGEVVCIDIGMAMQLEQREEHVFRRRHSTTSLHAWREMKPLYNDYFWRGSWVYPKTIDTCKALLFIKSNRPDILDAGFLITQPNVIKILSRAYDDQKATNLAEKIVVQSSEKKKIPIASKTTNVIFEAINKANKILLDQQEVNLENLKDSCIKELTRYLQLRGSIKDGEFSASLTTRFFRDHSLTLIKAESTKLLMNEINDAGSIEAIQNLLKDANKDEMLTQSAQTSGLSSALDKCLLMAAFVKENQSLPAKEARNERGW